MSWRAACEELARQLGRAPDDVLELWAERAAIREHDGGQPRAAAERAAYDDLRAELASPIVAGVRHGPRSASEAAPGRAAAKK